MLVAPRLIKYHRKNKNIEDDKLCVLYMHTPHFHTEAEGESCPSMFEAIVEEYPKMTWLGTDKQEDGSVVEYYLPGPSRKTISRNK